MGFLDNVKDALRDAVSTQSSKDDEAKKKADEAKKKADVVVEEKADAEPTVEATAEPTVEPTVGPVQPADSVVPAPATPTETAEEKAARQERKEDRKEAREDAREKREDAREAKDAKFETYTVRTGDSLSEIGARFGVPHLEIAKLNNIENPDLIFPGQVFRIPKN